MIEGRTTEGYVYLFQCFVIRYEPTSSATICIESVSLCVNSLLMSKNLLVSTDEEAMNIKI